MFCRVVAVVFVVAVAVSRLPATDHWLLSFVVADSFFGEHNVLQNRTAFALIEIMIVVVILAILAMIAVPKFARSSDEAHQSALETDLQSASKQIELYKHHHNGRGPERNEHNQLDTNNFIKRMTEKTTSLGALSSVGSCGPYLPEWPSNPFVDSAVAETVKFGKTALPPHDGSSGWYFSRRTLILYENSVRYSELLEMKKQR